MVDKVDVRNVVLCAGVLLLLTTPALTAGNYDNLPLVIEPNEGLAGPGVDFVSRGPGYTLLLSRQGATFNLHSGTRSTLRMEVVGASESAEARGVEALPGKSNYLIGSDPKKWRRGVSQYSRVQYSDIYPDIDLLYYGSQRQLEYDFVVRPGGDPRKIQLSFDGADSIKIDEKGELLLTGAFGEVRQRRPVAYQQIEGARVPVDVRFSFGISGDLGFEIGNYRSDLPLVIDPVLVYSSYIGGSELEDSAQVAVDAGANIYLAGITLPADFSGGSPAKPGIFVMKLNPEGNQILFSTFLGPGTIRSVRQLGIDSAGNLYVVVAAWNMPVTPNALSANNGVFVVKLAPSGNDILFSAGIPGVSTGVLDPVAAIGPDGSTYIAYHPGPGFAASSDAYQKIAAGDLDLVVMRVNSTGSALIYATLLGGSGEDSPRTIAVDAAGNAYITGMTKSPNFPATSGTMQASLGQSGAGFAAKLNPSGSQLLYSTLLPGLHPRASAIDGSGHLHIAGISSFNGSPLQPTPGAYRPAAAPRPGFEGYLSKLNPTGTGFIHIAVVGEASFDSFRQTLALDAAGNAYLASCATDVATTADAFQPLAPGKKGHAWQGCVHVAKFSPDGSSLIWGTYYGGVNTIVGSSPERAQSLAVDRNANVYISGTARSVNLPTTAGALKRTLGDFQTDLFVAKISNEGVTCSFAVDKTSILVGGAGGLVTVQVTAPPGCVWAAFPTSRDFVHAGLSATGIGSGPAVLRVDPNSEPGARIATASVAGHNNTISQAVATCDFVLQDQYAVLSSTAQPGTVRTAIPSGCTGTAKSNAPWITLSSPNVSGTFFGYWVAANPGLRRTGTITIGWHTFTVVQDGAFTPTSCTYQLSAVAQTLGITPSVIVGGPPANNVDVYTSAGCSWTAESSAPWINTYTRSGTGPGIISYAAEVNSGPARTASIKVTGGQTLTVSQPGNSCSVVTAGWTITDIPAAGGKGSFDVKPDGAVCPWSVSSSQSWTEVYPLSGSGAAAVAYTVYPNYTISRRYAAITVGGRSYVLSQEPAAGSLDERFVAQMYFNFFGRRASQNEIAFHVSTLKSISRADLIVNFMNSAEFNNGGRFIAGLYVGLLDRNAEYGGWLFQRNALSTGIVNPFQLVANFLSSAEWQLKFGTPTNQEFVRQLYRYVLLREASQSEINLQTAALAGGVTRVQLATNFLNTAEFRQGTGPRLTAFLLYSLLLLRDPGQNEMAARIDQIAAATPVKTIVQEIIGSSEFNALLN